ncbi:hypothetical protein RIR_jg4068.t1 [Rhizophagus irregularis DAOM 181602=DAOM 197198]|nr:hypothetical protein RIR_jg4068.t1 [Rhizophagus irregularis DAOM 181602=DAOM 197198]
MSIYIYIVLLIDRLLLYACNPTIVLFVDIHGITKRKFYELKREFHYIWCKHFVDANLTNVPFFSACIELNLNTSSY